MPSYDFAIEKTAEGYRYVVRETSFTHGAEHGTVVTVAVSAPSDDYAAIYRAGVAACVALDPAWWDAWADAQ